MKKVTGQKKPRSILQNDDLTCLVIREIDVSRFVSVLRMPELNPHRLSSLPVHAKTRTTRLVYVPSSLGSLALGIQRTVQEVRAGPTYCSNIEDQDVEVTTLPPPVPKPGPAGLDTTGKEFVFFDLETRGLERTSHIIQIAAVH
ncbi:hypothetical protein DPMN_093391 [Dreissena polymorpha]|uniref:Exonuclease domain-containing protein n=1 Tax=Dreissena polymorpha TaxID=45954 RepID=A0A9D4L3T3_DREPO|nr:hypothetical protein DPMN_093391 [Dreissena polymorpha]